MRTVPRGHAPAVRGAIDEHMLLGLVDIRPEERRNTLAAFVTLLGLTTGHTLLETARDVLFLAKVPITHLPWMYLVIVVLTLALSQVRGARADSKRGVAGSLIVAAVVTAGFWALVPTKNPSIHALYALYVWTGLFASWAMVQFWTLLGRIHTLTQAKRVYGFIGAGAVLGAVVGALSARAAMLLSPRSSILVSAIIFGLSSIPCMLVSVPRSDEPADSRPSWSMEPKRPLRASFELLWGNAFARRVLAIVLVSTITVTVGDYLFKSRVAEAYPDPRRLGVYLSWFYAATNALALVAQLLVGPWLFRRHGTQRALFAFPLLMLGAAVTVIVSGGRLASAVGLKAVDGGLRYSIHKTGTELLLVPVPDGVRERIKPIIDLIGARGGQALASVGILGLLAWRAVDAVTLASIVAGCAFAWIVVVFTIRGLYLDVFRETLRSGGISGKAELPELDLDTLETLLGGLNSSRDADVIAALEILAEQHRERLVTALILYHPSREVVIRALEIFTERGRTDFVSIADRLNGHPDREIAAAALRARTAVAPDRELLLKRLDEPCHQVSANALIALMARGWIDAGEADRRLGLALEDGSWHTASELARAIRIIAPVRGDVTAMEDRFDRLLVELDIHAASLRDATEADVPAEQSVVDPVMLAVTHFDVRVRLEVARAMSVRRNPVFVGPLLAMLARHELRATAREGLVGIPSALDALAEALASKETRREVRLHIPRTICLFQPVEASKILLRQLEAEKGGAVRYKVIRGLVNLRRTHARLTFDRRIIGDAVEGTLAHAEELRAWSQALGRADDQPSTSTKMANPLQAAHHLLADLVHDKELHATHRLFLLLELGTNDQFDDIWRGLRGRSAKARASSLELLENVLPQNIRDRVLALVEEEPAGERPTEPMSYEEALRQMVQHESSTLRVFAQYRADELGLEVAPRGSVLPPRASELATALGGTFLERARGLLAPPGAPRRPSRAPA